MKNLLLILAIFLLGCSHPQKTKTNTAFQKMIDEYYEEGLQLDPVTATQLGDSRYNNLFPDYDSDSYREKQKAFYTKYKDLVSEFDDADLSPEEQVSKKVLLWECKGNLEGLEFRTDYLPIDQFWTRNLGFGQFASGRSAQPFKTVEDYDNWLQRVDGYLVWMKIAEQKMREGMNQGYVLPKSLIVKVMPQLQTIAETEVKDNLFYSPAKSIPEGFSAQDKERLIQAYTEMVNNKVIPAYQELYHFVSTEYLAKGRESSGCWDLPNGEAYYKHQIKKYTTTNMTADEIHQLGLREVERISAEMEKVKQQVGFDGDLKAFFDYVRTDEDLMPYTDPQQVLDHFHEIYMRMKPQLEVLFDHKPKTPFEIRRTEAFREKSASAQYNSGSLDGTRSGIFYVPIPYVNNYNIYSDESLFLHEAIPGHHYQISLAQENPNLSKFRKTLWYSGYGEGWALYTESLGKELGLYTDPFQYFGMLSAEMHRAIRLVIDTGMHSKKWTRDQAIQYSLDHEAEPEESIIAEVERYMANPGQALSYKIGQLKIRELRNKAKNELGDQFDIRQFHNQVLSTGCVPLAILEQTIDQWIDQSKM